MDVTPCCSRSRDDVGGEHVGVDVTPCCSRRPVASMRCARRPARGCGRTSRCAPSPAAPSPARRAGRRRPASRASAAGTTSRRRSASTSNRTRASSAGRARTCSPSTRFVSNSIEVVRSGISIGPNPTTWRNSAPFCGHVVVDRADRLGTDEPLGVRRRIDEHREQPLDGAGERVLGLGHPGRIPTTAGGPNVPAGGPGFARFPRHAID